VMTPGFTKSKILDMLLSPVSVSSTVEEGSRALKRAEKQAGFPA